MPDVPTATLRLALVEALRDAYRTGLGVPRTLEAPVRAYARAMRLDGVAIEKVIIELKDLVRDETRDHEGVFRPRIVGWTVAGYFAGTSRAGES